MVSPYDDRTQEVRKRMMGERTSYFPNEYYKSAEGNFWFYINTKGYFHVMKPCRIWYGKEVSYYEMRDFLLKPDNTLKEVSQVGHFGSVEETDGWIGEHLAKDN